MAWGANLEQALLRLELVEHLATIAIAAAPLGGIEPLPASALAPLLAARAKANLGRAADRAVDLAAKLSPAESPRAVVACAPAPQSSTPTMDASGRQDLSTVVREEIVRALRGS